MINNFKSIFICLCLITVCCQTFASDNAGAFIEKGLQARSSAMGMGYVSVAENSDAIYWNPACLTRINKNDISIMGSKAYETDYLSFQYATKYNDFGIGFGYIGAAMLGIHETALGNNSRYEKTGNELSYQAAAYYLGAGKKVAENLSVGVTAKFIGEEAATHKAGGAGIDLGALYEPTKEISFGINCQNIIKPSMTWNTPSKNVDTIPTNIKTGISFRPNKDWVLSADVNFRNNRKNKVNFGCEYWFTKFLPLRAGLDENRLSLGTGL